MSDRDSPTILRPVFEFLAEEPDNKRNRAFAKRLWGLSGNFDFCDEDLRCDEALERLGLARKLKDGTYSYKRR